MDLIAHRVARRFVAEKLTKQWLMGIRRTWMKLLKPPGLRTWDDVQKAIAQLQAFVKNLRDEIYYMRRGPSTQDLFERKEKTERVPGVPGLIPPGKPFKVTEVGKYDQHLNGLRLTLSDAKSRAKHWEDVLEGRTLPGFTREEAEQSLRGWTTDFEEAISAGIKGPITKKLDKLLKLLRADAKTIVEHDEIHPETPYEPVTAFKEFDLKGMKVIVDDGLVTPAEINEYIRYLDHARALLQKKGFKKAWYGQVVIECRKCGGVNQYDPSLGVGGRYKISPNTVAIYIRPKKFIVELMIHELGHRWWFKHMTRENRLRFEEWIEGGLVPVSVYGGKHHHEAFAEAFAWYVFDRPLTSQQAETFKMVALGRRFAA